MRAGGTYISGAAWISSQWVKHLDTFLYMVSGFAGLEYKKVDVAAVKVAVLSIHRINKEGISMVIKTLQMDDIHNMIAFIH